MSAVTRHINNDGTETWIGLPVTLPAGLIPEGVEPVEVRSKACPGGACPWVSYDGTVDERPLARGAVGELRLILSKTLWTPPASLPDGEYRWDGESFEPNTGMWSANKHLTLPLLFGDWTDPPRIGLWRVEDGAATYLRDTR